MSIASFFRLLEKDQLQQIHNATIDVLAERGIVFDSEACLDIFRQHGARVEGKTVFISGEMVETALETVPEQFVWDARDPEHAITVGRDQNHIHVSMNNGPIYIQDQKNGRRLGTMTDLVNLYKLGQHSSVCDIVGQIPVEPSDVTHPLRYLDIFHQLLRQTDKPLFGYVGTRKEIGHMFDMLKIAHGKDDALFDQHRIAVSLNPLSPLRYDEIPCETLLAYATNNQPIMVLTCAMSGVSAPVHPIGTTVLQNAEILSGLVLTQLVNPGTPVIYSPASGIPDMRTAAYLTGSPESNLINMAGIQLARELYHLPTRCMAGLTDAKIPDCQAGLETMQNYLMLAMSGVHMVNECFGILDSVMTVSYEKFIIDEEIMDRAACLLNGLEVSKETLSTDMIKSVGHGGSYLMDPSTMKNCRNFWVPGVSTIDSYHDWNKKGGQDIVKNAGEKVDALLASYPETILDSDLDRELENYIEKLTV